MHASRLRYAIALPACPRDNIVKRPTYRKGLCFCLRAYICCVVRLVLFDTPEQVSLVRGGESLSRARSVLACNGENERDNPSAGVRNGGD